MFLKTTRKLLLAGFATGTLALAGTGVGATTLDGDYNYQSFTSYAASADGPARIAYPWTPPSVMHFTTDKAGNITGSAKLVTPKEEIDFVIEGRSSAAGPLDDGSVELTVTVNTGAIYKLQGYASKGSDHIVGTVVAISKDLGEQPDGQSGPFVLFPIPEQQ